jgi:stage II sporulation protein D
VGFGRWLVRGPAVALVVALPCVATAAEPEAAIRRLAAEHGQGAPLMRIGLEPMHAVEIDSAQPFRIVDPVSGSEVWKRRFDEVIRAVADGGPREGVETVYRVQVGAFSDERTAEAERARLSEELGIPGVVRRDPDRGNWRVRLGLERERLALAPLIDRLEAAGVRGAWIAEEPAEELAGVELRLVDGSWNSHPTGTRRLIVVPTGGGRIEIEGTAYRGVVELRVDEFGQLRPINWIELEQYLLGVVPRELGPEVWPQLESLKAQAVAARTYAWRNRGQFAEYGYDLCATPRCQVYGGATAEHPLSDRAVWATRGEVLTYDGEPIVAYYTATCGGHTEDGHLVFTEEKERPYLKGVPCHAENDALATLRATLTGRAMRPVVDETGADVTRALALLTVAGIVERPEKLDAPLDGERLRRWTTALAARAGLPAPTGPAGAVDTLGQAAETVIRDVGWQERASVLLSRADLPALLRDPATDELPETQRRALAYLASAETIRPFPDGSYRVTRHPTAAAMLPTILHVAESYEALGLREGVVSGVGRQSLRLVRGKGESRRPLSAEPALFSRSGGRAVPARTLEIWPGDRVRYRVDARDRIDFLEVAPPVKGVSDDRSAAVYSWEVRKTRRELEASINRRIAIGKLKNLEVLRRGVSGRVVELAVEGSRSSTTVRGFDVRRLLDLRESLIVLEVQRDSGGEISAVVFAGKGWGHGVGLCQVGAYGMAVRGVGYRDILGHYYSGARIEKLRDRDG